MFFRKHRRKHRKKIAEEVRDKMLDMGACPNETNTILHIISPEDYKGGLEEICVDCPRTDCWCFSMDRMIEKTWRKLMADDSMYGKKKKNMIEVLDKRDFSSCINKYSFEDIRKLMNVLANNSKGTQDVSIALDTSELIAYLSKRYNVEICSTKKYYIALDLMGRPIYRIWPRGR